MAADLVPMREFTPEQVALIKRTIAKGATDDELTLFIGQCKRTGLDPFSRQIHFVKRGGKLTIQTGIDGYRLIADRTGKYAGNDEPRFEGVEQLHGGKEHPCKATVTVWKIVNGTRCPFTMSARWDEYYPAKEDQSFMWDKMPYGQLAKCAEALALRKGFPQDLSGIYIHEEMDQANTQAAIPSQDNEPQDRPISAGQIQELRELCRQAGKETEMIAAWVSADTTTSLHHLKAKEAERAKKALLRAIEKQKRKADSYEGDQNQETPEQATVN